MRGKKALVFSGGGGKGAYQIGAWKALREIGFTSDIVVGVSIGSVNGALVALNKFSEAEEIWQTMNMGKIFTKFNEVPELSSLDTEERHRVLIRETLLKQDDSMLPLYKLITETIDEAELRKSKIKYGLLTTRLPNLRPTELFIEDMPNGTLADYIMASAACFPFVKPKKIGAESFVDGGYRENMPIQMAIKAGATDLVVVDIGGMQETIDFTDNVNIHYIRNKHLFNEFGFKQALAFDENLAKEYMQFGYLDTLKEFNLIEGCNYYFELGEKYNIAKIESRCADIYKRIFCCLPCEKKIEKMSRKSITDYLSKIVDNPFNEYSNVMLCAEAAAEIFEIDLKPVYTIGGIAVEIHKKLKSVDYEIENSLLSRFIEIIPLKDIPFKDKLVAEVYDMLLLTNKTDEEIARDKNHLWFLGITAPEVVAAGIFCAATKDIKRERLE